MNANAKCAKNAMEDAKVCSLPKSRDFTGHVNFRIAEETREGSISSVPTNRARGYDARMETLSAIALVVVLSVTVVVVIGAALLGGEAGIRTGHRID